MADPVRDLLADDDGDLAVVDGDFATVAGAAAIPQGIQCRVRAWQGEIILDTTQGVPYQQDVFGLKNPDQAVVTEDLREAIANTPDVTNVIGSALTLDAKRNATVDYNVQTVYSTETLTGAVEDIN